MKKQNILLLAALGIGAYFILGRKKRRGSVIVDDVNILTKEQFESPASTAPADITIDADKQGISLPVAIEVAKNVADKLKDAKIDIFKGGKKRTLRSGTKKVKTTPRTKINFRELSKKTGKKWTKKEQKAIQQITNQFAAGGFRFTGR